MTKMMPVTVRTNIDKSTIDRAGVDSGAKMLVSVAGSRDARTESDAGATAARRAVGAIPRREGKSAANGVVRAAAAGCCVGSASYERGNTAGSGEEPAWSAGLQTRPVCLRTPQRVAGLSG